MFIEFLHNVAESLLCDAFKAAERLANPFSNARAKSKGSQFWLLQKASKINWLP